MKLRCLVALAGLASPALASGDGVIGNWALNEFGGTSADRRRLYDGNPGVLMGSTPASLLFIGWRRLHGQTVGVDTGEALATPCCVGAPGGGSPAVMRWLALRTTVPGVAKLGEFVPTEREGPDYTSIPNCLDDAFRNAADTLQARIDAHGVATIEVRFWLAAQDTVFTACAKRVPSLPVLPAAAPDWLQADYRYQQAALAFYNTDYTEAAEAFAAIGRDQASPWHEIAPYLRARALLRRALASKTIADLVDARAAARGIDPASTLHGAARKLDTMAELRADPDAAGARLAAAVEAPDLTVQAAADFKDLLSLRNGSAPELLDWIATFKTGAAAPPTPPDRSGAPLDWARAAETRRAAALAHARERYAASHDVAWMLAALALMQPDDATDAGFLAEAAALDPNAPGTLTALYHRLRLANGAGNPAHVRAQLDRVLARNDLTATTRNLFTAERLQVAASLGEFARDSLRRPVCLAQSNDCKMGDWGYGLSSNGLFDAPFDKATVGLGDDARYLIDRMALSARMALGEQAALPSAIRMDVALTNFARAVLLQDDGAADTLASKLQTLLPPMAAEFAAVRAGKGPDKQIAEYIVFAKMPGLRADLLDYTRPVGAVAEFQGNWPNWVVLRQPDPESAPPAPALYDNAGYDTPDVPAGTELGNGRRRIPDVVCDGLCGAGGFVPRLPVFLADTAVAANAERRLLPPPGRYGDADVLPQVRAEPFPNIGHPAMSIPAPLGSVYMWDALLDFAAKHPKDARVPEVLHWLIHVGHFGQSHNHSGRRAFQLLRSRYPASKWAKQNPFYYD